MSNNSTSSTASQIQQLKDFTSYIPLRLSSTERSLLTVLESTLHVSEYTDNVDVASTRYGGVRGGNAKVKRILDGVLEACHVSTGLSVAGMIDHPSKCIIMDTVGVSKSKSNGKSTADSVLETSSVSTTKTVSSSSNKQDKAGEYSNTNDHLSKKKAKQAAKAKKKQAKKLRRQKINEYNQLVEDMDDTEEETQGEEGEEETEVADGPKEEKDEKNKDDNDDDETEDSMSPAVSAVESITIDGREPITSNSTTSSSQEPQKKKKKSSSNKKKHKPAKLPKQYKNQSSIASLKPSKNEQFFQTIFEIGRRNKVLNPSKMRDTYGKLMHLLQDAQSPSIARSLGFSLYKDLVMVRPFLELWEVDDILEDERLVGATMFVRTKDEETGRAIERHVIDASVSRKKKCVEELLNEYARSSDEDDEGIISREDLQRCIDSIADAIAVVESNVSPVRRMIRILEENFKPHSPEKPFSLELRGSGNAFSSKSNRYGSYGYGFGAFGSSFGASRDSSGPTLSHSHSTQYTFVWQSLNLWKEVQSNMHKLWVCADADLLSTTTSYQLLNTGQGLNRVQSCPRVRKVMSSLLSKTQRCAGAPWVGLSVIHLGDRDVPNALVFIDKYTQIPRFLKPLVDFIDGIEDLCGEDERIASYVEEQFNSERELKMTVLSDYFKHGFDGSGDDGGSCIDGRLTSSWNWTSRIVKKNYYHSFMLSGFQGFDGDFK